MRWDHVLEIGAGDRYTSEALAMAGDARWVSLYEPNQLLANDLFEASKAFMNVCVHPVAVCDPAMQCPLYHFGYASFLHGMPSFLATSVEDGYEAWWGPLARNVPLVRANDVIPTSADCLILTPNGAEMHILSAMRARPKVIRTKHYLHNARQWAEAQRVFGWMNRERYTGVQTASNQHGTFAAITWTRT